MLLSAPYWTITMIIRRLNLAVRSTLFFSVFCLLIVGLGVTSLQQAHKLRDVGSYFQVHIIPAVKELGELDANFSDVRFYNSLMRNDDEAPEERRRAMAEIQVSLGKVEGNFTALAGLNLDAQEQKDVALLQASAKHFNGVQSQYMALIAANDLDGAMKLTQAELSTSS
ncbi:MAG TPA: MCP four helix bundle domain-containing protein, partial [Methylophilaceae bacterium]|nr:MCP four helix bundle domain-containing protein [Methylophilaceae bacterium]